jgi:hypothetical protein
MQQRVSLQTQTSRHARFNSRDSKEKTAPPDLLKHLFRSSAVARPIPDAPPVITADLPLKACIIVGFLSMSAASEFALKKHKSNPCVSPP